MSGRQRIRALAACAALLVLPEAVHGADRPAFALLADGTLALAALPDVLARPEVARHLESGLTTSFVVEVEAKDARGRTARGAARIEVRYALWDEVFVVRAHGAGAAGAARAESSEPSLERLGAAWRKLRLPVVAAGGLERGGAPWRLAVSLSVVPFSQAEERDAQRWFSSSVGGGGGSGGSGGSVGSGGGAGSASDSAAARAGGVVDLLFATSIRRRSLVRYDWTIPFDPEPDR